MNSVTGTPGKQSGKKNTGQSTTLKATNFNDRVAVESRIVFSHLRNQRPTDSDVVWCLLKLAYGLDEAAREWCEALWKMLKHLRLLNSKNEARKAEETYGRSLGLIVVRWWKKF